MISVPEQVMHVTHPLVSSVYLKKNHGGRNPGYILVIEANFAESGDENYDACLTRLLGDLHDLQIQAEQRIGHFDRIDIRMH